MTGQTYACHRCGFVLYTYDALYLHKRRKRCKGPVVTGGSQ